MAPLFDVPVTITPNDRPLGTHVFTAEVDKGDANILHWSVVSLPVPARYTARRDEDERASRRRKMAGAAEIKALAPEPDSPAEALDRLSIPADAKARIVEAFSTAARSSFPIKASPVAKPAKEPISSFRCAKHPTIASQAPLLTGDDIAFPKLSYPAKILEDAP